MLTDEDCEPPRLADPKVRVLTRRGEFFPMAASEAARGRCDPLMTAAEAATEGRSGRGLSRAESETAVWWPLANG
jgi:hypothetical protein